MLQEVLRVILLIAHSQPAAQGPEVLQEMAVQAEAVARVARAAIILRIAMAEEVETVEMEEPEEPEVAVRMALTVCRKPL